MKDILSNMHLFVEVARTGGFRAAADRLRIPNSTLSRRIAGLEREIGLRLFTRTTRRVELTEAGRVYFERCRRVIDEARLAHEELSEAVLRPTGLIRASVPVDFTVVYLSDLLAEFLRLYPGISVELDVTPRQSDFVAEPVDLTIRIGEPKAQTLIARKLGESALALYAAPSLVAAFGVPRTPQDLLAVPCLKIADRPWPLLNVRTGEEATVPVSGRFAANNIGLLRRLALHGIGIGALPHDMVAQDVEAGRLRPVLPDWRPPAIPVYALTETRLVPARVRVFIDFLAEGLKRKDGAFAR
ncbi:LysR family transcriptional regulator [Alsobacter sp. R-9]